MNLHILMHKSEFYAAFKNPMQIFSKEAIDVQNYRHLNEDFMNEAQ